MTINDLAKKNRKRQTPAEYKLWGILRNRQIMDLKFRRQQAIGEYIVDFCCYEKKLIIELDGSQHLEQQFADAKRTKMLEQSGFQVIRFFNNDVLNDIDGVLEYIIQKIENAQDNHPHPTSPIQGEEL